jgi:hypothetical protein
MQLSSFACQELRAQADRCPSFSLLNLLSTLLMRGVVCHHYLSRIGAALNLSCGSSILVLSIGLYVWVVWDNKCRDQVDAKTALAGLSDQEVADLDFKVSFCLRRWCL